MFNKIDVVKLEKKGNWKDAANKWWLNGNSNYKEKDYEFSLKCYLRAAMCKLRTTELINKELLNKIRRTSKKVCKNEKDRERRHLTAQAITLHVRNEIRGYLIDTANHYAADEVFRLQMAMKRKELRYGRFNQEQRRQFRKEFWEGLFFANFADWKRPILIFSLVLLFVSLIFYFIRDKAFVNDPQSVGFIECLLFNLSMFTTLGYSPYLTTKINVVYLLASLESLLGFLVCIYYINQYIYNYTARKRPLAKKPGHSYYDIEWFKDFPEK